MKPGCLPWILGARSCILKKRLAIPLLLAVTYRPMAGESHFHIGDIAVGVEETGCVGVFASRTGLLKRLNWSNWREFEPNVCSATVHAFRSDFPPVRGHDVLHNGESQSRAVGGSLPDRTAGLVAPVETLKNVG